ncbi:MAG TPA: alpha/beta hydrolase, partial [Nevskiaceae bacterium]|nr:alpha/beta hydrolase [Nevskiaceae bacterium]
GHDYTLVEQADIHLALLAHLGVTRVDVLAHDYGVSVAQELLARELEGRTPRIDSVMLLNGGLFPEMHRARPIQKLLLSPLGPLLARFTGERSFSRSFSAIFGPQTQPSAEELHAFWQLVTHNQGTRIFHRLIRYIPERRAQRERWVGALLRTRVPLRLVNGPEDPVSGAHLAEHYRQHVPHPDIVSLPGIGHYPQVEAPAQVLAALAEFRARQPA